MPFTVSHVVAVLPLRRRAGSVHGLPAAPLVLGAMVPDLPMFLHLRHLRPFTHSVTGVITVDLPLVVLCGLLWTYAVREPVLALLPGVEARLAPPAPRYRGWAVVWLAAAGVGLLTHVVWDSFTHPDGRPVTAVPALRALVMGVPVHQWLQFGSGLLGLLVLAGWAGRWWTSTPRRYPGVEGRPRAAGAVAAMVVAIGCVAALRVALTAPAVLAGKELLVTVAAHGAFDAGAVVLVLLVAGSITFQVVRRTLPLGTGHGSAAEPGDRTHASTGQPRA